MGEGWSQSQAGETPQIISKQKLIKATKLHARFRPKSTPFGPTFPSTFPDPDDRNEFSVKMAE